MDPSAFSTSWITSISGGRKTAPTAGVAVALAATTTPCTYVTIQALRSNTGNITIGGSDVSGSLGSESGISLVPGQPETIPTNDLMRVYIAVDVNGEGCQYSLFKG